MLIPLDHYKLDRELGADLQTFLVLGIDNQHSRVRLYMERDNTLAKVLPL